MPEYPPDPGNVFASDIHRRVQANVPNPDEDPLNVEDILALRIAKDDHLDITEGELCEVLADLEAAGHSKRLKDGWKNTPGGFKALTGPSPTKFPTSADFQDWLQRGAPEEEN